MINDHNNIVVVVCRPIGIMHPSSCMMMMFRTVFECASKDHDARYVLVRCTRTALRGYEVYTVTVRHLQLLMWIVDPFGGENKGDQGLP
jgi:hypothetical protein